MRAFIVILVWAIGTVPTLATQPQAPDVIPRELAVALLDRFDASPTPMEIVVGRLPKSFPIDALPREGITILGGVERGWGAAVVAAIPQRTDSAAARVTAHLARAGWRRAEEDRYLGGFVPKMTARPTIFCRASAVLTFSARERRNAAGSLLHLGVSYPDDEYSACATRAQRRSMYERDFPTLPTLESPPGARMLGGGSGGGGRESREAYTRLATEQGAVEVGTHYAAQLQRAGWTVTAPIRANGMVVYRVQSLDAQKRPLTGALIALEIPETRQLDVVLRVARAAPDR
jgi:hypothetical protein